MINLEIEEKINQETLYAFVGSERERKFVIYDSESVSKLELNH